ncbi:hypothetical protein EJ03DRAFT_291234 [Teratosphaeria nubilosa]|uniref:Heterokaryon incompatibility domain-containing protein n=1 Tax=Teratosphaeria nubilosa TaxID=161662 RepID=A0A6G1LCI4_9PEZI|nr:hypothetical protein EJ03DRAFT_291234 [Teratosphaeria nubilosa]
MMHPNTRLSYVWGGASRRGKILIEGLPLDVPGSALHAIRQMRHQDQPRTSWIDAICIKQADIPEKTEQVSLMADIYSKSLCNLVWLSRVEANAVEYNHAFGNTCLNRVILITENGHLGLSPSIRKPDGIVAILWGSTQPVILRPLPRNGEFKVLRL